MRVRKKPWAEKELAENCHVVKIPQEWKGKWKEYFQSDGPLYVEIGCGKGRFLAQNARIYPENCYIGMEQQASVTAVAARKLEPEMKNIALLCERAEALADFFAEGEIDRIFLNFCDPWPRKKWAKRRLTYKGYLAVYEKLLRAGGELHFKTDNRGLFEFSLNEFCNEGWQMKNISLDLHHSGIENNIMTEYEEKFSEKGEPIYRLEAVSRRKE